jgi:hypothetical protein
MEGVAYLEVDAKPSCPRGHDEAEDVGVGLVEALDVDEALHTVGAAVEARVRVPLGMQVVICKEWRHALDVRHVWIHGFI